MSKVASPCTSRMCPSHTEQTMPSTKRGVGQVWRAPLPKPSLALYDTSACSSRLHKGLLREGRASVVEWQAHLGKGGSWRARRLAIIGAILAVGSIQPSWDAMYAPGGTRTPHHFTLLTATCLCCCLCTCNPRHATVQYRTHPLERKRRPIAMQH